MKINKLHIKSHFKNLEAFIFEDSSSEQIQVIVGQNGTGKSNFLEALAIIFGNLYDTKELQKNVDFSYEIEYQCNNKRIKIESELNSKANFWVNDNTLTQKEFLANKSDFLPKHLISYYSGASKRLFEIFDEFEKRQNGEFKRHLESPIMPIFYMQDRHSKLTFLTCIAFKDKGFYDLLEKLLGVISFEDVTFYLKMPNWAKTNEQKNDKFWGVEGMTREVLERMEFYSSQKNESKKNKSKKQFTLNLSGLQSLAKSYLQQNEVNEEPELRFFQALESLYWSELVENIKINVKSKNTSIPFTELSEGQLQLLLVFGFLRLFRHKEDSLFLLDEPDTHLNPMWKYHYLYYLREIAEQSPKSQILMASHEALVVNGLKKESIIIFKRDSNGKIITTTPEKDMIGMGMEEILTSDAFGLTTTLDRETYQKVLRKREIYGKLKTSLPEVERKLLQKEVNEIENYLEQFGL
jgi:predicted ATPase